MKASFSRFVFGDTNKITNYEQLRECLLNVLLTITVILVTALYAFSLVSIFKNGITGLSIVYASLHPVEGS